MNRTIEKKESFLVLLFISIFSLLFLLFSIRGVNIARDLTLQANMEKVGSTLFEYYISNDSFPASEKCNLKDSCSSLKEKIDVYVYQDIFYESNKKDYIIYGRSFQDGKTFFVLDSNLTMEKVLILPEL